MPQNAPQPESDDEPPTFETRVGELQEIVSQMEGGTLGLDEAMAKFERGVELLRTCFQTLEAAEARIEILTGAEPTRKGGLYTTLISGYYPLVCICRRATALASIISHSTPIRHWTLE